MQTSSDSAVARQKRKKRVVEPHRAKVKPAGPEATLEVAVMKEIGRIQRELEHDVDMQKNEVGVGYRGALWPMLEAALKPFGKHIVETALAVLQKNRITYGLGVGSPDLVGSVRGRRCDLELKADKGVCSPEQIRWHAAARERGQFVGVIRRADEIWPAFQRCIAGELE